LPIGLLTRGAAALGSTLVAMPAAAAIIVATPNADITNTPYTITFQPGEALSFRYVANTTSAFESTIGVQTTGAAQVFSTFGEPAYFQTFATSRFPADQLGGFQPYATPEGAPYSVAEGLVGFEYSLTDGVHYGFADVGGNSIYKYELDTSPRQSFSLAVPEPAAWGMLLLGFGSIGGVLRRQRAVRTGASLSPMSER
jgi:hypothetical protein